MRPILVIPVQFIPIPFLRARIPLSFLILRMPEESRVQLPNRSLSLSSKDRQETDLWRARPRRGAREGRFERGRYIAPIGDNAWPWLTMANRREQGTGLLGEVGGNADVAGNTVPPSPFFFSKTDRFLARCSIDRLEEYTKDC